MWFEGCFFWTGKKRVRIWIYFLRVVLSEGRVWGVGVRRAQLTRSMVQGVCQTAQKHHGCTELVGPILAQHWIPAELIKVPIHRQVSQLTILPLLWVGAEETPPFQTNQDVSPEAKPLFTCARSCDLGHLEMVPKSHQPCLEQGSDFPLGWCLLVQQASSYLPFGWALCNLLLHKLSSVMVRVSGLICCPVPEGASFPGLLDVLW